MTTMMTKGPGTVCTRHRQQQGHWLAANTLHSSWKKGELEEQKGGGGDEGGGGGRARGWPPLPPLVLMVADSSDMSIRCPPPSSPLMPAAWAACWG